MIHAHTAFYYIIYALNALSLVVLASCFFYGISRKPSKNQLQLCGLALSTFVMVLAYMLEMTSHDLEAALLAAKLGYLGKPFVMLTSFYFIATYCGYQIPRWLRFLLGGWSAFFPILIFTNDRHSLYYATWNYDESAEFTGLVLTRGPLYYSYMVTVFVYAIVISALTVKEYFECRTKQEKKQLFYFVLMSVFGVSGYAVYLLGVTRGYDSTIGGVTLGSLMLMILFFRFRILDFVNIAKDKALDDAQGGLLAFDNRGRIAFINAKADRLSKDAPYLFMPESLDEESTHKIGGRYYLVKKCLVEAKGIFYGTLLELSDVTDSRMYSAKLETEVAERTNRILFIQRTVIAGFANIIEARSGETGYHIKRTATYVSLLANELVKMGKYTDILTPSYIEETVASAPLHDVGKISVPDSILLKPGKLTPEEFEVMKKHSLAGVDIIEKTMRNVEDDVYVTRAEEVAEFHHEKWNGSGYPHGLAGEDIPLCARIMALADVYDALRSERCYKKAMDAETAKNIIAESSGTHFDPVVVEAFFSCLGEFEAVAEDTSAPSAASAPLYS